MALTLAWLLMGSIAAAQTYVLPNPDLSARNSDTERLPGGWYPWDPYQYRDYGRGVPLLEEHPLSFSTNRATRTPQIVARLNGAIDNLRRSGEFRRTADFYALPALINQTLDSEWFRILVFMGTVAFALSGIVCACVGQYTLFEAFFLASLPALGGGVVRDLLLQRVPIGIVGAPETLLVVFATVLTGMVVIKVISRAQADLLPKYLQSLPRLGTRFIEVFDAIGLAAFTVVGVVTVLDTAAEPLWLWGPIAAVVTSSFGGLLRDLFRHDDALATLRGELYPEIAAVWGFGLAIFLGWEGERLQPDEIRLAVIATTLGSFLTRIVAIARGIKGWSYV
jgi:polar amino acid transport system substrate-binding protein